MNDVYVHTSDVFIALSFYQFVSALCHGIRTPVNRHKCYALTDNKIYTDIQC